MDLTRIALHAINEGYNGLDLAHIRDALQNYGVDLPIIDSKGKTHELILRIELIADKLLTRGAQNA